MLAPCMAIVLCVLQSVPQARTEERQAVAAGPRPYHSLQGRLCIA